MKKPIGELLDLAWLGLAWLGIWTHSRLKNSLSDLVRRQSLPGWIPCHPLVKGNRGKPRHVPYQE